jgi:excisionase family DNA binding protein
VKTLADKLAIKSLTAYRLIHQGKIPAVKIVGPSADAA